MTTQNPYGNDLMVDQVLGSAYQVVRYVAANMDMLIELSGSIPTLTAYMPDIQAVLAAMPVITNVNTNMGAINNVNTNLGALLNINTNMAALLNLNNNLAAILAVPAAIAAQDWKNSVLVATTGNITLSGAQTVDGVALITGNRVLVKNQTTASQNGIYLANTGAWTRAPDGVAPNVSTSNMVPVEQGTVNGGKLFRLTTTGVITVGTTAQTWEEQFPEAHLENQGNGVSIVGSQDGNSLGVKAIKAGENMSVTDDGEGNIVLTASGGGGGATGDMLKSVYDTNNNGIVDKATGLMAEVYFQGAVNRGDPVYISGSMGVTAMVNKSDANSLSTLPAIGVAVAPQSGGTTGQVQLFGAFLNVNTGTFAINDPLFVAPGGGITNVEPGNAQHIGYVIRVGGGDGIIGVYPQILASSGGGGGGSPLTVLGDLADGTDATLTDTVSLLFNRANLVVSVPGGAGTVEVDVSIKPGSAIGDIRTFLGLPAPGSPAPIIEDFEDATLTLPFVGTWFRDNSGSPFEGAYCFTSAVTADNGMSVTELIDYDVLVDSRIRFTYAVSSEEDYDVLKFYIDGVDQTPSGAGWSGLTDWITVEFPVPAGVHDFKWEFSRDSSGGDGSNNASIDQVMFVAGLTANMQEQIDAAFARIDQVSASAMLQADWVDPVSGQVSQAVKLYYDGNFNGRNVVYGASTNLFFQYGFIPYVQPNAGNQLMMKVGLANNTLVARKFRNSPQHGVASLLAATHYSLPTTKVIILPVYVATPIAGAISVDVIFSAATTGTIEAALYSSRTDRGNPVNLVSSGSASPAGVTSINIPLTALATPKDQGIYWIALAVSTTMSIRTIDSWRAYCHGDCSVIGATAKTIGNPWPAVMDQYINALEDSAVVPLVTLNCIESLAY